MSWYASGSETAVHNDPLFWKSSFLHSAALVPPNHTKGQVSEYLQTYMKVWTYLRSEQGPELLCLSNYKQRRITTYYLPNQIPSFGSNFPAPGVFKNSIFWYAKEKKLWKHDATISHEARSGIWDKQDSDRLSPMRVSTEKEPVWLKALIITTLFNVTFNKNGNCTLTLMRPPLNEHFLFLVVNSESVSRSPHYQIGEQVIIQSRLYLFLWGRSNRKSLVQWMIQSRTGLLCEILHDTWRRLQQK